MQTIFLPPVKHNFHVHPVLSCWDIGQQGLWTGQDAGHGAMSRGWHRTPHSPETAADMRSSRGDDELQGRRESKMAENENQGKGGSGSYLLSCVPRDIISSFHRHSLLSEITQRSHMNIQSL